MFVFSYLFTATVVILGASLKNIICEGNVNNGQGLLEPLTAKKLLQYPKPIRALNVVGGVSGVDQNCFNDHRKTLESISIVHNNFQTVSSYTFSHLSLQTLDLRNNNIVHLEPHTFDGSEIAELNLNYNNITSLAKSMFSSEIIRIRLAKNKVNSIEPQCFSNKLQSLDLRHNLLKSVERNYFSHVGDLKELYLGNNQLLSADFSGNDLNKLEVLDLSFNKITNVNQTSFGPLKKLKYLNLTSNYIKWMSPPTLQIFEKVEVLDISFNYFTNFPYNNLPNSVEAINYFANPLNCECLFSMEKYFINNKISTFRCDSKVNSIPTCIVYGTMCVTVENESLISSFIESNISKNLLQNCTTTADTYVLLSEFNIPAI